MIMLSKFTLFKASEQSENNKNKLIDNLNKLKISQSSIDYLIKIVDKMPARPQMYSALRFLTEYTDSSSICEQHYLHSPHIAEYYCTLTNIGLFAVGCYFQDYPTLAAALFSTLSHAIPLKRLNELDKLAAVSVFLKVLYNYHLLASNPNILTAGLVTFTFGALDKWIGRNHLDTFGSLFHSSWHLSAAFALFNFNQAQSQHMANEGVTLTQSLLGNSI